MKRLYFPHHAEDRKDSTVDVILKIWIPLGALMMMVLGFFVRSQQIPTWTIYAVVAYFSGWVIVSLWKPGGRFYSVLKEKQRAKTVSGKYYSSLVNYAEAFLAIMDGEAPSALSRFFTEISSFFDNPAQKMAWNYDPEISYNIKGWHLALLARLKANRTTDFVYLAEDLQLSINQYHHLCLRIRRELEEVVLKNSIDDQTKLHRLKTGWNSHLGNYMDFIRKWQDFSREVNRSLGTRKLVEQYETVKQL